jgi:hypothetical protein
MNRVCLRHAPLPSRRRHPNLQMQWRSMEVHKQRSLNRMCYHPMYFHPMSYRRQL